MKKIKLDPARLLGFRILRQTPKIGDKTRGTDTGTAIKGKIGGKLGGKIGGKIGRKNP